MSSLNKLRRFRIVVERFAYLLHSDFEHRVADKRFRPKRGQQLVFGNHLTGAFDEVVKQGKRLGTDLQRFPILPKTLVDQIQGKTIERNAVVTRYRLQEAHYLQ